MTWRIELTPMAEDFLAQLNRSDKKFAQQIIKKLRMFSENPRQFGKPLKGDRYGIWRYRVSDYRILCQLQDTRMIILVLEIGDRKNIYD